MMFSIAGGSEPFVGDVICKCLVELATDENTVEQGEDG